MRIGVLKFISESRPAFFVQPGVFERYDLCPVIYTGDSADEFVVIMFVHLSLRVYEVGEVFLSGIEEQRGAGKAAGFDTGCTGINTKTQSAVSITDGPVLHTEREELPHVFPAGEGVGEISGNMRMPEQEMRRGKVLRIAEKSAGDNVKVAGEKITFTGMGLIIAVAVTGISTPVKECEAVFDLCGLLRHICQHFPVVFFIKKLPALCKLLGIF